jgi:hypothetical protein
VAFETRRKKKAATQQQPAPLTAAAAATAGSTPAAAGQAPCCTPPGSPRQQQAAPLSALTSPGKLDTLLPGYVSCPNSSPVKARLLTAPPVAPVQLASGNAEEMPPQHQQQLQQAAAEPLSKRARTLLSLAAARYGGGSAQAAALPAEQGSAAAALEGPAGLGHLHADLRAELQQAALLGQQREGQRCAVEEEEGQGAAAAGSPGQVTAAAKPRRAPIRGSGSSKRKQPPAGKHADAAAAAAAATEAETLGTRASGPQLPTDAELDAAAAALPLPPLLQRLEASFVVLAQLHAFLTSTHIQVPCPALPCPALLIVLHASWQARQRHCDDPTGLQHVSK